MRTVKQEPFLEAMPADYNPNEVEEPEYRPLLTRKRRLGSRDTISATAPKDSKKPRKVQEETNPTSQKSAVDKPTEMEPMEEILAGSHMCVLHCGEEVEDFFSNMAGRQVKVFIRYFYLG